MLRAVGSMLARFGGWLAGYETTDPRCDAHRDFRPRSASADQTLVPALPSLVAQCRHLERNSALARGAVEGLRAGIIGSGIDLEPASGDDALDELLAEGWQDWTESAGVAGETLWELQSQALAEIAVGGASLWRLLTLPERLTVGQQPLAILALSPEWLSATPLLPVPADLAWVGGVLYDRLRRPVWYDLRDPDRPTAVGERVAAAEIIHCFERRRAGQGHGEPLIAPALGVIHQGHRLVGAELATAELAASLTGKIKTLDGGSIMPTTTRGAPAGASARKEISVAGATLIELQTNEDADLFDNSRPSQAVAAFLGALRGMVAACCRVSQAWLDRDTSRATYSADRSDHLRDRLLHGPLQNAFGRHLASRPYAALLPWLLLEHGVPWPQDPARRRRLLRHELLPDRMGFLDPTRDAQGAILAVDGTLSSLSEEVGARGKSLRAVVKRKAHDARLLARYGFSLPQPKNQGGAPPPVEAPVLPAAAEK